MDELEEQIEDQKHLIINLYHMEIELSIQRRLESYRKGSSIMLTHDRLKDGRTMNRELVIRTELVTQCPIEDWEDWYYAVRKERLYVKWEFISIGSGCYTRNLLKLVKLPSDIELYNKSEISLYLNVPILREDYRGYAYQLNRDCELLNIVIITNRGYCARAFSFVHGRRDGREVYSTSSKYVKEDLHKEARLHYYTESEDFKLGEVFTDGHCVFIVEEYDFRGMFIPFGDMENKVPRELHDCSHTNKVVIPGISPITIDVTCDCEEMLEIEVTSGEYDNRTIYIYNSIIPCSNLSIFSS